MNEGRSLRPLLLTTRCKPCCSCDPLPTLLMQLFEIWAFTKNDREEQGAAVHGKDERAQESSKVRSSGCKKKTAGPGSKKTGIS